MPGRLEEGSARSSEALDRTLAQSDRVTLALLRKLDDPFRDELSGGIGAINKPEVARRFLQHAR
jgi:hypothetical protein